MYILHVLLLFRLLPCGAYEMYVIILPASSQTLPCQLTGGTSCPTMICPNTAVNYTCNVGSYAGNTLWNVPSVSVCSGSTLTLAQGPPGPGLSCLTSSSSGTCGPFTVTNTPPLSSNVYCLTSTLSVVVTSAMNGLVVSCSSYSPTSFTTAPVGNATISVVCKSWVYTGFEGGSGSTLHVVVLHHSLAEYALYGIISTKRDLMHVFSRFQCFRYSKSLTHCFLRTENRNIRHWVVRF